MAIPKCPKCESTRFQLTENAPTGSKFKILLIHCGSCGCVVGNEPYYNTGALIEKLGKKLGVNIHS